MLQLTCHGNFHSFLIKNSPSRFNFRTFFRWRISSKSLSLFTTFSHFSLIGSIVKCENSEKGKFWKLSNVFSFIFLNMPGNWLIPRWQVLVFLLNIMRCQLYWFLLSGRFFKCNSQETQIVKVRFSKFSVVPLFSNDSTAPSKGLKIPKIFLLGVVASTCNRATKEAEFRKGADSVLVGDNNPSIGGWIVWPSVFQDKDRSLTKYWDPTET